MTDKKGSDQSGTQVNGPKTDIDEANAPVISGNVKTVNFNYSDKIEKPLIPCQIPLPPQDFTGREYELQELLGLFERDRAIIGLRGLGGVGKTALAFALAERLKDHFPDGQLFVSMQGTSAQPLTPMDAMAQVIRSYAPALRLPENEAELANLYRSVLTGKRALLLLDNALNDGQIRPLLPPSKCCLIVTSRRKFTLPGIVPKDLEVLKLDKAVELLNNTAGMIFYSNLAQKRKAWEDLARLCGCLPVALRAVGSFLANTPDSSPEQYARELQDEKKRLQRIGKEGVEEDLDLKLSLSYRRLEPETARVFRELSVFPFDFDAKAEEAICMDEGHSHLSELVRWSLAEYRRPSLEGEGRYHLHDLVRVFAAALLEGEKGTEAQNEVQQRHAQHFMRVLSVADNLLLQSVDKFMHGLELFDLEWSNIQAGLFWAENYPERLPVVDSLCCAYPNAGIGVLPLRRHPQELIRWYENAMNAALRLNDRSNESASLCGLASAYIALGNARKAIEYLLKALYISRETGDRKGEGANLAALGRAYADLGKAQKAIEYYEQALPISRQTGNRRGEGANLAALGRAYADLGKARKAIEYYEQALPIARQTGDRRGEGANLAALGRACADLGKARKAIEYYERALPISRETGDRRGEGNALWSMSLALEKLGDKSKAICCAKSALKIFEEIEDPKAERVKRTLQ